MIRSVNNISKKYGERLVLDRLTISFSDLKPNIIMGQSGAGKTTLLRIICGLEKADEGDVSEFRDANFSMVFQEDRLLTGLSALKNVQTVSRLTTDEIVEMFRAVGLSDSDISKPVFELSGGMARRTAIVRALAAKYDVLILDEPFKGLDEATRAMTAELVRRYASGKMMLMVTHDNEDVEFFGGVEVGV